MLVLIGILLLGLVYSCKLRGYDRSQRQLCECLSGVRAPADEFCTKWNENSRKWQTRVDAEIAKYALVLEGFPAARPKFWSKYCLIKAERDTCMARISRYYGGH